MTENHCPKTTSPEHKRSPPSCGLRSHFSTTKTRGFVCAIVSRQDSRLVLEDLGKLTLAVASFTAFDPSLCPLFQRLRMMRGCCGFACAGRKTLKLGAGLDGGWPSAVFVVTCLVGRRISYLFFSTLSDSQENDLTLGCLPEEGFNVGCMIGRCFMFFLAVDDQADRPSEYIYISLYRQRALMLRTILSDNKSHKQSRGNSNQRLIFQGGG